MKTSLKLEELAFFILSLVVYSRLGTSWGLFALLLFAPDLSMVGYLAGTKAGALVYNVFHHRGLALLVFALGEYYGLSGLSLAGVILFAHSSLDRVLGYGLKFGDSFQHTHLGWIGQGHRENQPV